MRKFDCNVDNPMSPFECSRWAQRGKKNWMGEGRHGEGVWKGRMKMKAMRVCEKLEGKGEGVGVKW